MTDLPLAEEIPNDRGGCPTCKAMFPANPASRENRLLFAKTGYCSEACFRRAQDPARTAEPRKEYF